MKGIQFDNAAQRKTYVGMVYEAGTSAMKQRVLQELPEKFTRLHSEGHIHIHDLEAYGQTYNCLQMDVQRGFPVASLRGYSNHRKVDAIFDHFRNLVVKLGNEQSGGIGFPNFDADLETLFDRVGIAATAATFGFLKDSIEAFIDWCNESRERCGQTTYYVSLNLGLSTGPVGRFVARTVLEYLRDSSLAIIKPNLIFKVKAGVNRLPADPNYDLFDLAVESTCRKMLPTYLLFDSVVNARYDPFKVAIMGCRTKVVADLYGDDRSIGRGNIDYVTINLPRIALEIARNYGAEAPACKVRRFKEAWDAIATTAKEILVDRYQRLLRLTPDDFPCCQTFRLWLEDLSGSGLEKVFCHGTFSVGFIGLSEAVEVLTGEKYYASDKGIDLALDLVRHMRSVVDGFRESERMNFTLLATSGEYISGRFPELDRKLFDHEVSRKGFYTNSFHVEVDSGISPFRKIEIEGPFHSLANGGCISYVEFSSPPLGNKEAVADVIRSAVEHGVNYLGINFPPDQCRDCGERGTFDRCPGCSGTNVYRIRRVSGYLEDLEFFTSGKKCEVGRRTPNAP